MHGLICFLADPVKFAGISGRRWDWLTLLRWLEFVTFGVYFRDFHVHFGGVFGSQWELNGCKWPRVTKMVAQGGTRKRF